MKTRIRILLLAVCALLTRQSFAQANYEIGLSYRYIKYNEAALSFTSLDGEYLHPHELDANFRFDISADKKFRGTLVLGWTKYEHAFATFPNPLFSSSCPLQYTYTDIAQEYNAYRFNPGIEYEMQHGKISYSCGAGLLYYGTFRGSQAEVYTTIYQHQDSTGQCVEDSSAFEAFAAKAQRRPIALVGLSAHLYLGYEAFTGITFFVMGGINPMVSIDHHEFSAAPSVSIGVYFRFNRRLRPD